MANKDKAQALLTFLEWCHADDYTGLDDDMPDACNDWISDLTDDYVCDLVLSTFHEGI
jgi:hypothetical protein